MQQRDAAQVRATVEKILQHTPAHVGYCRPLTRALMSRIAEELKNVSRETKPAAEQDQPEGATNENPV